MVVDGTMGGTAAAGTVVGMVAVGMVVDGTVAGMAPASSSPLERDIMAVMVVDVDGSLAIGDMAIGYLVIKPAGKIADSPYLLDRFSRVSEAVYFSNGAKNRPV